MNPGCFAMLRRGFMAAGIGIVAALQAAPVLANGFTVYEFGTQVSAHACLSKAEKVMRAYITRHGGDPEPTISSYGVYGWALTPGAQDVAIICPELPDGSFFAFMIVHGSTTVDADREFTAETIDAIWFNGQ